MKKVLTVKNPCCSAKKLIVKILVVGHLWMAASVSFADLPRPTDRWRSDKSGSFISGLDLPIEIKNALPELAVDGIKSGKAKLIKSPDGRHLIVDQDSARLLAYWQNYNVGSNNSVEYKQPSGSSVALNIIRQESPSEIWGSLKCNGACWLINPNGFLFGENSSVDTRGLIAAAMEFNGLPIDGEPAADQLEQFENESLFDAINRGEAFLINAKDLAEGTGDIPRVIVKKGASINSASAPALLAAPEVLNEGSITSDSGQVVLAGSRKDVYLALTNPVDTDYRGYLIEVDSGDRLDDARGAVVNAGALTANLGNVTLVASEIINAGKIKSSTAVDVNGSVRILARDRARAFDSDTELTETSPGNLAALYVDDSLQLPLTENVAIGTEAGDVSLRPGSSIEISVDSLEDSTAADSLPQPRSEISIEGKSISLERDSSIVAPAGNVNVRARENPIGLVEDIEVDSEAFFRMDDGSTIDVSGTEGTLLPVERNTVEFFITSNELRDASQQKGGVLLRETVNVDVRRGTPLFDWTEALDNVQKTASERSATGGNIDIFSKGNATINNGATLDVSGGIVNYEAGYIHSSKLIGRNGLVDISEANPFDPYSGVFSTQSQEFDDPKWGKVSSYRPGPAAPYFRDEYFEGKDAGSITISSPQQQIGGSANFFARTKIGEFQRNNADLPVGGSINLNLVFSAEPWSISVVDQAQSVRDQEEMRLLQLSKNLLENSEAGEISIDNKLGDLEHSSDLVFLKGTSLKYSAKGVYLLGDIRTAGGDVSISQVGPGELAAYSVIDTSGNWTNFNPQVERSELPSLPNAGDISLNANGRMGVFSTAKFVANAGAINNPDDELNFGQAGNIKLSIKNGDDVGQLNIEGTLNVSAVDAEKGGRLTMEVGNVTIGGFNENRLTENLQINNSFFENTQVGSYRLVALDGNVNVKGDTFLDLTHKSLVVDHNNLFASYLETEFLQEDLPESVVQDLFSQVLNGSSSRTDASSLFVPTLLPDYHSSPGELMLEALRVDATNDDAGILAIEDGAKITGPALSNIDFLANNRIYIDGDIDIAGGTVQATLQQTASENSGQKNYILIGQDADVDVSSNTIDIIGESLETNKLFINAGSLNLNALFGYAVVAEGANLDLSGELVDTVQRVYTAENPDGDFKTVQVPLSAGRFSVLAEKGFDIQSDVNFGDSSRGFAGGTQSYRLAQRNSIDRLGESIRRSVPDDSADYPELNIQLGDGFGAGASDGLVFGDEIAAEYEGVGRISSTSINSVNTDKLILDVDNSVLADLLQANASVTIKGNENISANSLVFIDTPNIQLEDDATLSITSSFVSLGESEDLTPDSQFVLPPVSGLGQMSVEADLIDLFGNISISGTESISFDASTGLRTRNVNEKVDDINRLAVAELTTQADLFIRSPVLWGETLSKFRFNLTNPNSLFQFTGAGSDVNPLSVGSEIVIQANNISINSAIAAPLGSIELDATEEVHLGSNANLTVEGSDYSLLGRIVADEIAWIYQIGEKVSGNGPTVLERLPEKRIEISAESISAEVGSEVNLAGGGKVLSREFVAGLGGSVDLLENEPYTSMFAVVPYETSGFAPYDQIEFEGSGIPWGATFEIAGSAQLASGSYTILPASYALLPGAFLVTPETPSQAIGEGFSTVNRFGAEVVSGQFKQMGSLAKNTWQGFRIEPGSVIQNRAEYRITDVDGLIIPDQPGTRPIENGRLVLNATDTLAFLGGVKSSDSSPVGVSLDLAANGDIIFGDVDSATALIVDPALLSSVGADSVLVGAERDWIDGAWQVSPIASSVTFDGISVDTQELVVSAINQIRLINGSKVQSIADASFTGNRWSPDSDAVTLLSSTTSGSMLDLSSISSPTGELDIEVGSELVASGTLGIIYDGAEALTGISFDGRSDSRFQLATDQIVIGDTFAGAILNASQLQAADNLELKAGSVVSFNQSLVAETSNFILNAEEINLEDAVNVDITAEESISIVASGDTVVAPIATVGSRLSLVAENIIIQSGSSGSDASTLTSNTADTELRAGNWLSSVGVNDLQFAGDLEIKTPLIGARGLSDLTVRADGNLNFNDGGFLLPINALNEVAPAASFNFSSGGDTEINTSIVSKSGLIAFRSDGELSVNENALLDVSPFSVKFPDQLRTAPAGIVSLLSSGDLSIDDPTVLDFGTDEFDGEGGLLELLTNSNLLLALSDWEPSRGNWSSGGLGLRIQADNIERDLDDVLFLNGQGFDGDIDLLLTGASEDINVAESQKITATDLRLATLDGQLVVSGNLEVSDATADVVLHGGAGVDFTATASLSVQSDDQVDTFIESPDGAISLVESAQLLLDGGLRIVKPLADVTTDIVIDATDTIATDVQLLVNQSFERSTFNQADFDTLAGNLVTAANGVNAADFIDFANPVIVRPYLDVYSNAGLTVSAVDLTGLRTSDGQPGLLSLRSKGDIDIIGGINAATNTASVFLGTPFDTEVLLSDDSWGISIAAGTSTSGQYRFVDRVNTTADLVFSDNTFVRTGTGDIELSTSGDLVLEGNSYLASVGKTDYLTDAIFFAGQNLPAWGEKTYSELYGALSEFSGFSREAGNVSVNLGGDLFGNGISQTSASFIQRLSVDDWELTAIIPPYVDYRTWALAVDRIEGGIHSVGGGNVNVRVAGGVDNIGFSTPGLALGDTQDKTFEFIPGGKLNVFSRGDISHSSFSNDGTSIHIRSLGSIGDSEAEEGSTLFVGSFTDINVQAGRGLTFDSILNTYSIPASIKQRAVPFVAGSSSDYTASTFMYGFDETAVDFSTVTGNIRKSTSIDSIHSFLPAADFETLLTVATDGRLFIMPSDVSLASLSGNVVLGTNIGNTVEGDRFALFPSENTNLVLAAGSSISSDLALTKIRIPDITDENISSIENTYLDFKDVDLQVELANLIDQQLEQSHSETVIDRSESDPLRIYALGGSIGDEDTSLRFEVPKNVEVFAGQNITNVTFDIQHYKRGLISEIFAGGDIQYPIQINSTGGVVRDRAEGIQLAGPGDLIVSAGGDITLGTTSFGIQSVGNLNNPALPAEGAALHVLAGHNGVGDYKKLVGNGIATNNEIYSLSKLGLGDSQLDSLSLVGWFEAFANSLEPEDVSSEYLISNVSRATGKSYNSVGSAFSDWKLLSDSMKLRVAVSSFKDASLADPSILVDRGAILFAAPDIAQAGFGSIEQRRDTFASYWNSVGGLIALEYLLTPNRVGLLLASLDEETLNSFASRPVSEQLTTAVLAFDSASSTEQMLIAEQVMLNHVRQSGLEGLNAGNALVNFERGYTAQRMFFGSDFDRAIAGVVEKANQIISGEVTSPSELTFGDRDGQALGSVEAVLDAWQVGTDEDFSVTPMSGNEVGDISLKLSTIRTLLGGDINILAPSGSVDVGLAAAQLELLDLSKGVDEQGVLAFGLGDINGLVGNAYNVNESRSFSLAGGNMSLWSSFGDIDAGKGAKTAFVTPPTEFQISNESGEIRFIRPPAVSGSGIRTSASRSITGDELTAEDRFYDLAEGAGGAFLATPLGIVDAGEAGIDSAGDLFIAAAEVRGADNINVGGVSVGVASDTSVSASVGNLGNAANAATESAQNSATSSASGKASSTTAFITIELIETGT